MEGLQKVVGWFLDANDGPNSHQNIIITFWPIYNVPWNLMQVYSVVFALSRQMNKQKYAKTINLLCAGNKVL